MKIVLTMYFSDIKRITEHTSWEELYGAILEYSNLIDDRFNVYELAFKFDRIVKGELEGRQHLRSLRKDILISINATE